MNRVKSILLVLITSLSTTLISQDIMHLDSTQVDTILHINKIDKSKLNKQVQSWIEQGYWEANIDQTTKEDSLTKIKLHRGIKYDSLVVNLSQIDSTFIKLTGYDTLVKTNFTGFEILIKQLLSHYQEQGFIFTTINSNAYFLDKTLNIALDVKKNRRIYWGDIVFGTDINIPQDYIFSLIGTKKGKLFKKSDIKKLQAAISELKYIELATSIKISFFRDQAEIKINLKKKPANNFDVLLGLQTNTDPLATQNFIITGTAHIDIYNIFNQGENLFAEYKQIQKGSQKIRLKTTWPFIKLLPAFGVEADFLLYKRDTSSLEVNYKGSVIYNISNHLKIKSGTSALDSRVLNIDTTIILASKKLPTDKLDIKHRNINISIEYKSLNNTYNPQKGLIANIQTQIGQKNIIPNDVITNLKDLSDTLFSFKKIYDDIELKTFIYNINTSIAYYIPIKKRSSIKTSIYGGLIQSKGQIYDNESFRLGGHSVIRGFNEEEIITPIYLATSLEYRFLLGRLSHLFGFIDGAWIYNKSNKEYPFYMGVGVGMNLSIKGGLLGMSYAIGKRESEGLDFKNSKIHFKYVNYF